MTQFLTPKQFMARHGLKRDTVYPGIRDGSLPSLRISKRKILIPEDALDRMLDGPHSNSGAPQGA